MDNKFTEKIKSWLDTPKGERDLQEGATLLLKLSNNQVMYRNIVHNISAKEDIIEYNLRKYYKFRLEAITDIQVKKMESEVKKITETIIDGKYSGKRPDHDNLPDEVIAIYKENLNILRSIQDLHRELSLLETKNVSCPASEKWPFVAEIIKLDKIYRKNWEIYDKYTGKSGEEVIAAERKAISVNALRFVNLNKGKYRKNPTGALKEKIKNNYDLILAPTENLTAEMKELGII